MRGFFFTILAIALVCPQLKGAPVWAASPQLVSVTQTQEGATRLRLPLGKNSSYRLFFLNNPPRAVLDLPARDDLSSLPAFHPVGVATGWRSGRFGDGTRFVLDLAGPVRLVSRQDTSGSLLLDLSSAGGDVFQSLIGQAWGSLAKKPSSESSLPSVTKRAPQSKPLIVIDAGHGGVDPGALSVTGSYEKHLTLALARQLALQLESSGLYQVEMTRSRDVFVPLRERVAIARRLKADLFISLHADSIARGDISGATVYTLSEKASDAEAQALAESENRADELAGLEQTGADDVASEVLIAMSHRASLNGSQLLARQLLTSLRSVSPLTEKPIRSAGFAVLKAPDIPSVLIEMGYLSSSRDFAKLSTAAYQHKLVKAIELAVGGYFKKARENSGAGEGSRSLPSSAPSVSANADLIAAGLANN